MLFWAMKWTTMSVVLILVMHHLYIYFMDTLTVPMNKDFIHKPVEKYKEMLDTIRDAPKSQNTPSNYSLDNVIPKHNSALKVTSDSMSNNIPGTASMQNELQNFLNELKQDKSKTQSGFSAKPSNVYSDALGSPLKLSDEHF